MRIEPDAEIMENGLEQLREMIARDRNHPSVVVWACATKWAGNIRPRINLQAFVGGSKEAGS